MCGIAGWFGPSPEDAGERLSRMVAAIRHRGPDGEGQWIGPWCALGHARLSIIDLDGGRQPMEAEGVVLCYNGEVYNYAELRAELSAQGYPFRTHSDTEAILALYRTQGWQALARLRGMYAFALWDGPRNTGYLVRDPLGIKPLFFSQAGETLLFGSEAKAILAQGAIRSELDEGSLHLAMNFRYLPGTRSMFRGIEQLAPGAVIEWRPEGVRRLRLPEYDFAPPEPAAAIADSVRAHLTADVEVAAYLSGGIDSGLIAALARQGGLRSTFTLAVGDDPAEAANAAATARLLGLENRSEAAGLDLAERLPRLVRALEVPKINSLQVSQLAAFAARHVKVALSGLGGDELFYGYQAHRILDRAARIARFTPRFAARLMGNTAAGALRRLDPLPWTEAERAARMLAELGAWPRVYGLLRNLWDAPELRRQVYGPRMLEADLPDPFAVVEGGWPADPDPVAAMARYERGEKMVNDLLWQEDRASMAEGLEVRTPFVDLALTQSVGRLTRGELMPGGRLKARLRAIAADHLPPEVLNRPKSGFQVHAPTFFHQHLMPLAQEWLGEERLRAGGLFNPDFVRRVLAAPPHTRYRWHYFMLYMMLMSELWMAEFLP